MAARLRIYLIGLLVCMACNLRAADETVPAWLQVGRSTRPRPTI